MLGDGQQADIITNMGILAPLAGWTGISVMLQGSMLVRVSVAGVAAELDE